MKTVTENVYQITRGVNCFLLKSAPDELTLVDTGIPGTTKSILDAVEALGYTPRAVRHILITHADLDHVGSLHGIVQATGATVYAGAESRPFIENAATPPHLPALLSPIVGVAQHLIQKPVQVNQPVQDGEILNIGEGVQVLYSPGHTPDNYTYLWNGVLFAADLLNTQRGGKLDLTLPVITWDMDKARESARRALDFDPQVICVGHGDSVTDPAMIAALRQQL